MLDGGRLERHQQEHDPRRGDREAGAVDGPGLSRLELGAGAGVVAQEPGEVAQQPPEVTAADLAGDAQALDDPVADRVGEALLEAVEALPEPAGDLVVERELGERHPQGLRAAGAERGDRVGQRQPGSYGAGEVVDRLGPHLREVAQAAGRALAQHGDREVGAHDREDQGHRQRARHGLHHGEGQGEQHDAQRHDARRGDVGEAGAAEQSGEAGGARALSTRGCRGSAKAAQMRSRPTPTPSPTRAPISGPPRRDPVARTSWMSMPTRS